MNFSLHHQNQPILLKDGAKIVVVGGGPAGCFFAIEALNAAHKRNKSVEILIIEQKREVRAGSLACREGCNYCAGGISPRLADVLDEMGISIPPDVIQSRVDSLTIQGNWKHIEIPIPPGKKMFTVYRGTRPRTRTQILSNFDSCLLECALERGAQVITGEVFGVDYTPDKRPFVRYRGERMAEYGGEIIKADFVVIATGVNQMIGENVEKAELSQSLQSIIPGFQVPRVRKALIFELKSDEHAADDLKGEICFIEYGSKEVKVEMSSFLPKDEGFITVAILGASVDRAKYQDKINLVKKFLELPHVKSLLPSRAHLEMACVCFPNMTVGTARHPLGHRIAVIGDMAVTRLYKDGLLSANYTARALAACIYERGVDVKSLHEGYLPTVRAIHKDNKYGGVVFFLNRIAFSDPVLSRILYQAVLTQRKNKRAEGRDLEDLLWKIASGDDSYEHIFWSFITLKLMRSILIDGALVTLRNYLTEILFGLHWGDIGRYPTGVYCEVLERKRHEYLSKVNLPILNGHFECERMYSIKIRAKKELVFQQLGKFGEEDMEYFQPRIVRIRKVQGQGNDVGKTICYDTHLKFLSFSIRIEAVLEDKYIVYRVADGFAKGGVLIFEVDEISPRTSMLSIYIAFNFPKGSTLLTRTYWRVFKLLFPQYTHDVLWNYSLCQLREIAEGQERE